MRPRQAALVTGSSRGLGAAISRVLAERGYYVYITAHDDHTAAERTVAGIRSLGGRAEVLPLDVTDERSVRDGFDVIGSSDHRLAVLVNNAATEVARNIEEATFAEWRSVIATKLDGSWLCTKYALPMLKESGNPNVVFVTSGDSERPDPEYLAYYAATAGVIAMAKALATSLPRYGIRVNAVSPGPVRTPLWDSMRSNDDALWREFSAKNPLGRVATPEDIAEAVWVLVNDPTRYLNGNVIYVNGGSHLV
jgi:NAD(P)-dependent dehydrogenase (short-subunit alcohol dehydrogenase family)